jgi:purine-binding chemotaxis protein CheW
VLNSRFLLTAKENRMSVGVPAVKSSQARTLGPAHTVNSAAEIQLLTITLGNQAVGVPITRVRDVLFLDRVTRVPLAPEEILGVINLRGRIVTVIDARRALNLPPAPQDMKQMCVTAELGNELYGIAVDRADDLLTVKLSDILPNPSTLRQPWRSLSHGIIQLPTGLLAILDLNRLLARGHSRAGDDSWTEAGPAGLLESFAA